MVYDIAWSETSVRQMEKLAKKIADRITKKVENIAANPFDFVKKLQGFDLYRLRIGDYRVIMSIENNRMIIFVLEVGHRSVIYRRY